MSDTGKLGIKVPTIMQMTASPIIKVHPQSLLGRDMFLGPHIERPKGREMQTCNFNPFPVLTHQKTQLTQTRWCYL